jgi:exopolysaccharide production protein ExoQ
LPEHLPRSRPEWLVPRLTGVTARARVMGPDRSLPLVPNTLPRDGQNRLSRTEFALAALSLLAIVISQVFGTLAITAFIAAALALAGLRFMDLAPRMVRFLPIFILPLLAMISTVWSDAPQQTMRIGMELTVTFFGAAVVATVFQPRDSILMMFAGILLLCLMSLHDVPDSLRTNHAVVGAFQSKNALGFHGQMLELLGMAIVFDRQRSWALRLIALGSLVIALLLVYVSHSSGAQLTAAVTLAIFPILLVVGRLPTAFRVALLGLAAVFFASSAFFYDQITDGIAGFRHDVLGKDATLTGRTLLWDIADKTVSIRPWLGHGFGSFWREGNIEAEAMWRHFGIAGKHGFNFHNAFIEMSVDLGRIGEGILIATCAAMAIGGLIRQLRAPTLTTAFFVTFQASIYLRSLSETGLVSAFYVVSVLWVMTFVYTFGAIPVGAKWIARLAPPEPRRSRAAPRLGAPVRG